jgi:hypothetical protein
LFEPNGLHLTILYTIVALILLYLELRNFRHFIISANNLHVLTQYPYKQQSPVSQKCIL